MGSIDKGLLLAWAAEQLDYWESHKGESVEAGIIAIKDLIIAVNTGVLVSPAPPADCVEALREALEAILPMAKGYAALNNVGNNSQMITYAETALSNARPAQVRLPLGVEFALDYLLGYMEGEPEEARNKLQKIADHLRPPAPQADKQ